MGAGRDGLDAGIGDWVERTLGEVVAAERLVSGNSRTTWALELERGGELTAAIVRVDEGDGPFSGTPLDLAREARTYAALQGTGVRIPRLLGYDAGLDALALERAPGAPAWDEEVLAALLAELARLHALELAEIDLPGERTALAELELWATIAAERLAPPSPTVEFGIEFLRERFPGEPERTVVVHGDPGAGNLLWEHGAITALLDWELTHAGDPYDDLAFLTVRTAMHGIPLAGYGEAVREHYFRDPAAELDEPRLRYWQAVAVLRNLITCEAALANPVPGRDRLVHRLLLPSLNRLLVGTLAAIDGVELPEPASFGPAPRLPGEEALSQIAAEVAALGAGIEDPELRQRGRRARYLLDQLAMTWPLAGELAAAAAAEGPPADDPAERLAQLARAAERELVLFPRAAPMAHALPQGFG